MKYFVCLLSAASLVTADAGDDLKLSLLHALHQACAAFTEGKCQDLCTTAYVNCVNEEDTQSCVVASLPENCSTTRPKRGADVIAKSPSASAEAILETADMPELEVKLEPIRETADMPELEVKPEPILETADMPELEVKPDPIRETADMPELEVKPDSSLGRADMPELEVKPEPIRETADMPELEVKPEPILETADMHELEVAFPPTDDETFAAELDSEQQKLAKDFLSVMERKEAKSGARNVKGLRGEKSKLPVGPESRISMIGNCMGHIMMDPEYHPLWCYELCSRFLKFCRKHLADRDQINQCLFKWFYVFDLGDCVMGGLPKMD